LSERVFGKTIFHSVDVAELVSNATKPTIVLPSKRRERSSKPNDELARRHSRRPIRGLHR